MTVMLTLLDPNKLDYAYLYAFDGSHKCHRLTMTNDTDEDGNSLASLCNNYNRKPAKEVKHQLEAISAMSGCNNWYEIEKEISASPDKYCYLWAG